MIYELSKRKHAKREDVWLILTNAMFTFAYLGAILFNDHRNWMAFSAAMMSVAHFAMIAGIIEQAYGSWMSQMARNLSDPVTGFLSGKRYLVHDRDRLFTKDFKSILRSSGVGLYGRNPCHQT